MMGRQRTGIGAEKKCRKRNKEITVVSQKVDHSVIPEKEGRWYRRI
jgi:hypothetical protein